MNINNQKFISLYQKGISHKQIAFELRISKTSVGRIKSQLGLSRQNIEIKVPKTEILQQKNDIPKLAMKYNVRKSSLYERLRNLGIVLDKKQAHRKRADINRIYVVDCSHFKNLDRIGCYYLGLIYADGSIFEDGLEYSFAISLKREDEEILYRLASDFNISSDIIKHRHNHDHILNGRIIRGGPHSYLRIQNYHLLDILRSYGLNPGPQYKQHLPNFPFMADFLRGFLDGDGTICKTSCGGNRKYTYLLIQFSVTHKSLALELNNFLQTTLNAQCSLSFNGSIYYLKTVGSKAEKIAKWLWDDPIRTLVRKYQIFKDWFQIPLNTKLFKNT